MALRPAGDTRTHLMAAKLSRSVEGKIFGEEGSGTDKAHVANKHIPELREFIDGSGANETSYIGKSLFVREEIAGGISFVGHCLELDNLEDLAILAGAFLEEEGTAAFVSIVKPNGDGEERES